jgi:hypothetical protein
MSNVPREFCQAALALEAQDVGAGMQRLYLPLVNAQAVAGGRSRSVARRSSAS